MANRAQRVGSVRATVGRDARRVVSSRESRSSRARGTVPGMPTSIPTPLDREFASSWIDAWNSGDLERVFALYADDFEMRSPLIVQRGFSPTGALRGKEAIRPYWSAGITTAKPPLRFELIDAYAGVAMVAIHFRSVGRKVVIELLEFDERGLVIRDAACHGTDA